MAKQFQRTIEDFVCEQCGASVAGSGYTNHCPHCLYSKHVDIAPGDRAARCGGQMPPVAVVFKAGEWIIEHRCLSCGFSRNQRSGATDNFDVLVALSRRQQAT